MADYRVVWTIELDADTPLDAAKKALQIQRDKKSIATQFDVTDLTAFEQSRFDLSLPDGTYCDGCCTEYTQKDLDGGRCLSCGRMIT